MSNATSAAPRPMTNAEVADGLLGLPLSTRNEPLIAGKGFVHTLAGHDTASPMTVAQAIEAISGLPQAAKDKPATVADAPVWSIGAEINVWPGKTGRIVRLVVQ